MLTDVPRLPTDNLYKFAATFGLVLVVAGFALPLIEETRANELHSVLERDSALLQLQVEADSLGIQLLESEEAHGASPTFEKHLDSLRLHTDSTRMRQIGVRKELREAESAVELTKLFARLGLGLIAVGSIISFWGFVRWYSRVQVHIDRAIERDARGADVRTTKDVPAGDTPLVVETATSPGSATGHAVSKSAELSELTPEQATEVVADLRDISAKWTKEISTIVRQLALAGLAVIWLFKSDLHNGFALQFDLLLPTILLIIALIFDFSHWALGAMVWSLDRRYHMQVDLNRIESLVVRMLFRTERVRGAVGFRLRPTLYLLIAEIAFIAMGYSALLVALWKLIFFS